MGSGAKVRCATLLATCNTSQRVSSCFDATNLFTDDKNLPGGRGISFHLGSILYSVMMLRRTSGGICASFRISVNRKSWFGQHCQRVRSAIFGRRGKSLMTLADWPGASSTRCSGVAMCT